MAFPRAPAPAAGHSVHRAGSPTVPAASAAPSVPRAVAPRSRLPWQAFWQGLKQLTRPAARTAPHAPRPGAGSGALPAGSPTPPVRLRWSVETLEQLYQLILLNRPAPSRWLRLTHAVGVAAMKPLMAIPATPARVGKVLERHALLCQFAHSRDLLRQPAILATILAVTLTSLPEKAIAHSAYRASIPAGAGSEWNVLRTAFLHATLARVAGKPLPVQRDLIHKLLDLMTGSGFDDLPVPLTARALFDAILGVPGLAPRRDLLVVLHEWCQRQPGPQREFLTGNHFDLWWELSRAPAAMGAPGRSVIDAELDDDPEVTRLIAMRLGTSAAPGITALAAAWIKRDYGD